MTHPFSVICVRVPKVKEGLDGIVENEETIKCTNYFRKDQCGEKYKMDLILEITMLQ